MEGNILHQTLNYIPPHRIHSLATNVNSALAQGMIVMIEMIWVVVEVTVVGVVEEEAVEGDMRALENLLILGGQDDDQVVAERRGLLHHRALVDGDIGLSFKQS